MDNGDMARKPNFRGAAAMPLVGGALPCGWDQTDTARDTRNPSLSGCVRPRRPGPGKRPRFGCESRSDHRGRGSIADFVSDYTNNGISSKATLVRQERGVGGKLPRDCNVSIRAAASPGE